MSDDDNWEVYVPQVGERYAEGGQVKRRGWSAHNAGAVVNPNNDLFEYRRPKQKAEEPVSEPAAQPSEYEARVTQMTVTQRGKPTFDESETRITIEDEGGGEFVEINQSICEGTVRITIEEWPTIREAINAMIQNCRAGQ